MPPKATNETLELPLKNGFRRGLVKRENDKLVSVYYVTPNNKYLKDVSEVCDWLEEEKQEDIFNRRNFSFVAKKMTSHEAEFIIDYDSLPNDIRNFVIQKKRSIAPSIVTLDNDNTVTTKVDTSAEIPNKRLKIDSSPDEIRNTSLLELSSPSELPTINIASNGIVTEETSPSLCTPITSEDVNNDKDSMDVNVNGGVLNEAEENTSTMSAESLCDKDVVDDLLQKYRQPFAYPLDEVDVNSIIGVGSNCHVNRALDARHGDIDEDFVDSMVSYCGCHCAFDNYGYPRVAFECDVCLIMWHNDCIGHRWMTVGPASIIICDNCYLLRKNLSVDIWNTFTNVEKLMETEYQPDKNITLPKNAIPAKLESIYKLCKLQWILQNKNKRKDPIKKPTPKNRMIGPRKNAQKEVNIDNHITGPTKNAQKEVNIDNHITGPTKNAQKEGNIDNHITGPMKNVRKKVNIDHHIAGPRKNAQKEVSIVHVTGPRKNGQKEGFEEIQLLRAKTIPTPQYRYFLTISISPESIHHEISGDSISLKYTMKNVDKMANIFADTRCEMLINNEKHNVFSSRITVKDGVLTVPVSGRISSYGYAMFYTLESGQDNDPAYISRYGCLKSTMCVNEPSMGDRMDLVSRNASRYAIPRNEVENNGARKDAPRFIPWKDSTCQRVVSTSETSQPYFKWQDSERVVLMNDPHSTGTRQDTIRTAPITNSRLSIHTNNTGANKQMFVSKTINVTSLASKPLPNQSTFIAPSAISPNNAPTIRVISKQMITNTSSLSQPHNSLKIVNTPKLEKILRVPPESFMMMNSSMVQYFQLTELPFLIIEKILMSRQLSTIDLLNCRAVNRTMKCVIDGGRVWNKVVINPCLVNGLQSMFDFFSTRNVKKMTFTIDFKESFGYEFFTSFISRLKLYPDSFHLNSLSLKMVNLIHIPRKFCILVQDILSGNKVLKRLSVSSDESIEISMGKSNCLRSDSLECLKLTNIENILQIMQTVGDYIPKLKKIHFGDCSQMPSILSGDLAMLINITSLRMDFSSFVHFSNKIPFSILENLEHLIISRPLINDNLTKLLDMILAHKSLTYFRLDVLASTKDLLWSCCNFGTHFPAHIRQIEFNVFVSRYLFMAERSFANKVPTFMPRNTRVTVFERE